MDLNSHVLTTTQYQKHTIRLIIGIVKHNNCNTSLQEAMTHIYLPIVLVKYQIVPLHLLGYST